MSISEWESENDTPAVQLEQLAEFPVSGPATLLRQSMALEALEDREWFVNMTPQRRAATPLESLPVVPPYSSSAQTLRTRGKKKVTPRWILPPVIGAAWSLLSAVNPSSGWLYEALRADPTLPATAAFLPGLTVGLLWSWAITKHNAWFMSILGAAWFGTALSPIGPVFTGGAAVAIALIIKYRLLPVRRVKPKNTHTTPAVNTSKRLFDLNHSAEQLSLELRNRAYHLGLPCADADKVDLVAAVVGADVWLIATGADRFEQAASFGVRSLGALAAVYARSAGYGEDVLGSLPGEDPWPITQRLLFARLPKLHEWAVSEVGAIGAANAFEKAASDLAWGGGGNDRCGRASRAVWEYAVNSGPTLLK
jgi:hypothetical protein